MDVSIWARFGPIWSRLTICGLVGVPRSVWEVWKVREGDELAVMTRGVWCVVDYQSGHLRQSKEKFAACSFVIRAFLH